MVTVRCFVWALGLQLWSVSEAVRQNFKLRQIFKILYLAVSKHFLVLTLHLMLDGLILFCKSDFCRLRSSKLDFKRRYFWRHASFQGDSYLNSTTVLFD